MMTSKVHAIVCVGVLICAATASAQAPATTPRLQSLVNDTAAQFQLAYRHNLAELELRRDQLRAVISAWRDAERSKENNERLADWLRAAIRNSMPGARELLPPAPRFDRRSAETNHPATARQTVGPRITTTPPRRATSPLNSATDTATASDQAAGDPFRDDPQQ